MSMKWFSLLEGQLLTFVALALVTLIPILIAVFSGAWICERFKNAAPETSPITVVNWEE